MDVKPVAMLGETRRSSAAVRCHRTRSSRRGAAGGRVYCCGIGTSCTFIASATEV
jgi:hypothetical protein